MVNTLQEPPAPVEKPVQVVLPTDTWDKVKESAKKDGMKVARQADVLLNLGLKVKEEMEMEAAQ